MAIDVNTGRFVGKDALEDTVFAVNLEAVPEVARQIRLRDLGGLLVVDFIDMEEDEHRQRIFERFEEELARDRARTRILPISEFGLIEITRQRSRGNLERVLTRGCPACSGSGRVKTRPDGGARPAAGSPRAAESLLGGRDDPRARAAREWPV